MRLFFEKIDFTFGAENSDIKPSEILISENNTLSQKLKNNVFVYNSPEQTNSSFYVIAVPLSGEDFFELSRYIWNENKYDLFFLKEKAETNFITTLYYAKTNPRENQVIISSFSGDKKDNEELEKIRKWNFQSGTFWLSYADFLDKVKKSTRVDKKLIEQLRQLKGKLQEELILKVEKPDEIVQALIDRTLFIKFLEDNHIINSFFYKFHFPTHSQINNVDFGYKTLLKEYNIKDINKLFDEINKLFNNVLFKTPAIKNEYLSNEILNLIYEAIRRYNWEDGQLSLFDFRFDVIPIEFISHIYEVFLESNQLDEGIYYTPDKLAHLIIDDTIKKTGTVLDPACGSGMFLVLAFRKLLEYNPPKSENVYKKIEHKNKLLKDYIYGIEKDNIAWRLTIFSLYLEILKGIPAEDIKVFIKEKLENNSGYPIFHYDFSDNIENCNSLEIKDSEIPHKGKSFDYIVGNPPFFEIKPNDDEINFINKFIVNTEAGEIKVKDIIGHYQISQAFMIKIRDWAKPETRFGFVQNSSNFYNEMSLEFQKFFFKHYQIENFYDLSRVKEILFRKAKESVVVTIFTNRGIENNKISYYPVDIAIFSKIFDLLIIKEDKKIELLQKDILDGKIILRDYLIGNNYDLNLINEIKGKSIPLNNYILNDNNGLAVGIRITGSDKIDNNDSSYSELSKKEKKDEFRKIKSKFISKVKNEKYTLPYIEYRDINAFEVIIDKYLDKNDLINKNYRRNKNISFFVGEKLLLRKIPRVEGTYIYGTIFNENLLCFPDGVFCIRLNDNKYYHLFTAILNSNLINHYINLVLLKRSNSSFSHIGKDAIRNIPIPKNLEDDLVTEISRISKQLTEGKLKYEGNTKEKLNDLIYNLYDLGYIERQRIRDFFSEIKSIEKNDLENYRKSLFDTLEMYFKTKPFIESYQNPNFGFNMIVTAIYFNDSYKTMPSTKKTFQYIINKIVKESNENFIALKEKIFINDCIYIIKDNQYKNWSETKAFEDGKEILILINNERLY